MTTETLRYLVLATPLKNVWSIYQGTDLQLRLGGTLSWQLYSRMFRVSIKVLRYNWYYGVPCPVKESDRYLVLVTDIYIHTYFVLLTLIRVFSVSIKVQNFNWDCGVPCPVKKNDRYLVLATLLKPRMYQKVYSKLCSCSTVRNSTVIYRYMYCNKFEHSVLVSYRTLFDHQCS
jgi:hypothetical protein